MWQKSVLSVFLALVLASCAARERRPQKEIEYHAARVDTLTVEEGVFEITAVEANFAGVPVATDPDSSFIVLENIGYVVGYSEERKNPLWASYRLFPVDDPERHDRPGWRIDDRTIARVKDSCYVNSGYDRGHNAPNSAIDTRYGEDAQQETFFFSNVSPQTCKLNREPWQGFEAVIETEYTTEYPEVWVVNGPIFDESPDAMACEIEIPIAFYKIVAEDGGEEPRALAVVMAQEDTGWNRKLKEFVTTVDCIEQLTGLDFFSELPDDVEAAMESAPADSDWHLNWTLFPAHRCPGGTAAEIDEGNARRAEILASCE